MRQKAQIITMAIGLMFWGLSMANGQSLGTAFTYQGQLKDGGQAADGLYDLRFKIFDAPTGGNQIGGTLQFANYLVSDGLFTVELDFTPAVYNNNTTPDQRWLEVIVEQTVLSPRQPLSGVPYSIQTRGLDVVEDGGGMRVGVGRAGNDTFNVFTDTTGFAGMRVETPAMGSPRYGYQSGNNVSVYHYLDYDSQTWRLNHGGTDKIVVNPGPVGFVGINRAQALANVSGESFGIYNPTSGFGGMIMETDADGEPYYGYGAAGELKAYHYYDDDANRWIFRMPGINAMSILTNGNVGIGFDTPGFKFQVNGECAKPGGGSWSNSSDRRLKKNIKPLQSSLEKLLKIRGVNYEYIHPKAINELDGERIGVIAQELEEVFPDWVTQRSDGYKAVTFRGFEAVVVEAIRELRDQQNEQIETLECKNEKLQDENQELRDRMEILELHVQQLVESLQTQR